jgi:hypothetical protein
MCIVEVSDVVTAAVFPLLKAIPTLATDEAASRMLYAPAVNVDDVIEIDNPDSAPEAVMAFEPALIAELSNRRDNVVADDTAMRLFPVAVKEFVTVGVDAEFVSTAMATDVSVPPFIEKQGPLTQFIVTPRKLKLRFSWVPSVLIICRLHAAPALLEKILKVRTAVLAAIVMVVAGALAHCVRVYVVATPGSATTLAIPHVSVICAATRDDAADRLGMSGSTATTINSTRSDVNATLGHDSSTTECEADENDRRPNNLLK